MKSNNNNLRTLIGSLALSLCACALAPAQTEAPAAEEEDYEIKSYSPRKYASSINVSAFELDVLPPARVIEEPEPEEPFEFRLVSVTSNSGSYRATLVDKKGKYVVVNQKENKETGFFLSDIEPADNIQDVRVKVAKGGQSEWVEFDSARFKMASKKAAPKAPTNTRGRPNIVPSSRNPTPARTNNTKSSSAAKDAIEKANAAAREKAKSSSRSNGRRVVLPPTSRQR